MQKGVFLFITFFILSFLGGFYFSKIQHQQLQQTSTLGVETEVKEKPFDKYSFDELKKRQGIPSQIILGDVLEKNAAYTSYLFYFMTDGKKVSGMLNVPTKPGTYPIIEMNRGFQEAAGYQTGNGTRRASQSFVQNGYITIAPDFLGYAKSDKVPLEGFGSRFTSYTTVLDLLASLSTLNMTFQEHAVPVQADLSKIGMWGHSNGGHITLSILSITGKAYPTVLWNPVSTKFPDSVLKFASEEADGGVGMRGMVADFKKNYDIQRYSPPNYYPWIQAPIQLHQGMADTAVPPEWSNTLNDYLKSLGKDITYYKYPGDDHNFSNNWGTVVQRNIEFYNEHLK
jgi:dipeptidyl aminopeptidase/acylaminoacyl peptidase